jgi:hypothetical protein
MLCSVITHLNLYQYSFLTKSFKQKNTTYIYDEVNFRNTKGEMTSVKDRFRPGDEKKKVLSHNYGMTEWWLPVGFEPISEHHSAISGDRMPVPIPNTLKRHNRHPVIIQKKTARQLTGGKPIKIYRLFTDGTCPAPSI